MSDKCRLGHNFMDGRCEACGVSVHASAPISDEAEAVVLTDYEGKRLFDAIHDPAERGLRTIHERVFPVVRSIIAARLDRATKENR